MEVLELHLTVDAKHVTEAARALRQKLTAGHWTVLASLAAEVVRLHEAETGATVLVLPADRQVRQVMADLGAPGLERAADRALGRD